MGKGTEKSKEKRLKNLYMQLVQYKDNPAKAKKVEGRIATLENSK